METVLAFIMGLTINLWFVIPLFIVNIFWEAGSSRDDTYGFSSFLTIILTVCVFMLFKPSWLYLSVGVILWLPIGAVWAIHKWKIRIGTIRNSFKEGEFTKEDFYEYRKAEQKIDINQSKSTVAHWVLCWHISMLATLVFDIFEYIEYLITVKFGKIFKDIAQGALDE